MQLFMAHHPARSLQCCCPQDLLMVSRRFETCSKLCWSLSCKYGLHYITAGLPLRRQMAQEHYFRAWFTVSLNKCNNGSGLFEVEISSLSQSCCQYCLAGLLLHCNSNGFCLWSASRGRWSLGSTGLGIGRGLRQWWSRGLGLIREKWSCLHHCGHVAPSSTMCVQSYMSATTWMHASEELSKRVGCAKTAEPIVSRRPPWRRARSRQTTRQCAPLCRRRRDHVAWRRHSPPERTAGSNRTWCTRQ